MKKVNRTIQLYVKGNTTPYEISSPPVYDMLLHEKDLEGAGRFFGMDANAVLPWEQLNYAVIEAASEDVAAVTDNFSGGEA